MSSLDGAFGISPGAVNRLNTVFDTTPNLARVWIFGSRAQGSPRLSSDIDLAVDAPDFDEQAFNELKRRIDELELIYRTDVVWLQAAHGELFKRQLDAHRRLFWMPPSGAGLPREPGSAKGQVLHLADDFDAPLADLSANSD